MASGGAAGATSLIVVYPLDFARTRLAVRTCLYFLNCVLMDQYFLLYFDVVCIPKKRQTKLSKYLYY